MFEYLIRIVAQGTSLKLGVAQGKAAIVIGVDGSHLDVGLAVTQVVLVRQTLTHIAVAAFVVNG